MQVGVLSLSQLQFHDHYDYNSGGPINVVSRAISANVRISGSGAMTAAGVGVYACLNRILFLEASPGGMTINFTLTRAGGAGDVNGQWRIYSATGVLLHSGIDRTTNAGPTIYSENIAHDFLENERLEFWGYVRVGATTVCDLSAEELCYDATITYLSRRLLTTALPITGVGLLYENVF
jgi:hypothetical protein